MSTEERLKREKEFHNETFANDSRHSVGKYYKSANRSKDYYKQRIFDLKPGESVLEYGCGPGSNAFDLAKKGAEVYAIDISDVAIELALEEAKRQGVELDCRVMDAENLTFGDDSFDLICGSGILHHLDLKKAYSELQRTLKTGGRAVFFEPLGHNPIINLYRNLTPAMRTEDEHPLLMKDIDLLNSYFKEVKITYFNLLSTAGSFLPFLVSPLNKVDDFLFKRIPFLRKHAWIIVLEISQPK